MALSRFAALGLLSFALAAPVSATAESPALLWKARGLQGQERFKKLQQAPPGETAKERRRREIERMLELSFSAQVETPEIVHHTFPNGGENFEIILAEESAYSTPNDISRLFILHYSYDSRGKLVLAVVEKLPLGWSMGVRAGEQGTALLLKIDESVMVVFDALNPFSPSVIVD
jgi:hypothetical protein